MCSCCAVHHQVHCLVENGAVLDRADNGSGRGSDRTSGCQNPALVASLLKKASKTGTNPVQPLTANMLILVVEIMLKSRGPVPPDPHGPGVGDPCFKGQLATLLTWEFHELFIFRC